MHETCLTAIVGGRRFVVRRAGCNAPDEGAALLSPGRSRRRRPPLRPHHRARWRRSRVNTAPDTGAAPVAGASVDARVLVITANGDSRIRGDQTTLQYLGTPFDVINAGTGPTLTANMLASGTHGKYDAIFLNVGNLTVGGGSGFTRRRADDADDV